MTARPPQREEIAPMLEMLLHRGPDQGDIIVDGVVRAGQPPPRHSRPLAERRAADAQRRRHADHRLQRRNLQSPANSRRRWKPKGCATAATATPKRLLKLYRRDGAEMLRSLRGMFAFALWDRGRADAAASPATAWAKSRSTTTPTRACSSSPARSRRCWRIPAVPRESALDARHAGALSRPTATSPRRKRPSKGSRRCRPAIASRSSADGARSSRSAYWTLPMPVGVEPVSPAREREKCGSLRRSAGRSGAPVAAERRAAGRVPERRAGQQPDRRADAPPQQRQRSRPSASASKATPASTKPATPAASPIICKPSTPPSRSSRRRSTCCRRWSGITISPSRDSSAIPTYLVSKLTREHVTVALTGDGGDELFAGYERFYAHAVDPAAGRAAAPRLGRCWRGCSTRVPEGTGYYNVVKRARRFVRGAALLARAGVFRLHPPVRRRADRRSCRPTSTATPASISSRSAAASRSQLADLLHVNMRTYLPDDLLIKTDRSSMAASLETRAPLLDHWLVEMAATIPLNLKLKGSTTKYILKQIARDLLPPEIVNRPQARLRRAARRVAAQGRQRRCAKCCSARKRAGAACSRCPPSSG